MKIGSVLEVCLIRKPSFVVSVLLTTGLEAMAIIALCEAGSWAGDQRGHLEFPAFLIILLLLVGGRRTVYAQVSQRFGNLCASIRLDLVNLLMRIEPLGWERIEQNALRNGWSSIPAMLTSVGKAVSVGLYVLVYGLAICAFLIWLFWPIGVMAVLCTAMLAFFLLLQAQRLADDREGVFKSDSVLRAGFADLAWGRKEVLLDPRKGAELVSETIAGTLAERRILMRPYTRDVVRQTIAGKVALDIAIFLSMLVSVGWAAYGGGAVPFVALLLLSELPFSILDVLPVVVSGEESIRQLNALHESMAEAEQVAPAPAPVDTTALAFRSLDLKQVVFRHPQTTRPFKVGPVDLHIEAGTITFLTGANGSGKSTALRILTGLYPKTGGTCLLNGAPVDLGAYRSLFALVLFDQPVLDSIYGAPAVEPEALNALLDDYGIGQVTRFANGRFTRLDLSSGQRKRLGLVLAVLDGKPILVFDEWAAEQDPAMRERFYRELLPAYKAAGRTIIAVTHDAAYFGCCDQLVEMRDGKIHYAGAPREWKRTTGNGTSRFLG